MDKIPELTAKNIPSNFEMIKKKAKKCLRCGEPMITDIQNQHFCQTCRGGEMGINDFVRFKETWEHGTVVTNLLEEMRR